MQQKTPRPPAPPDVSRYLASGLTLALSTLGFLWLGTVVDGWLATDPVFTLVGAFVGAAAGFWSMIRQLARVPPRRQSRAGDDDEERPGRADG